MFLSTLNISGYRSVRALRLPLGVVNVIVGPNGAGKTNIYRALYLAQAAAKGELAQSLAEEGGIGSALWAGQRRKGPVRIEIGLDFEDIFFTVAFGLPVPTRSAFVLDPEIKEERIEVDVRGRRVALCERRGGAVTVRNDKGARSTLTFSLTPSESMLAEVKDPQRFPEIATLRQELSSWRFYHHFSTHIGSPLRNPRVSVRTTSLGHSGEDLAAALQTILEIGDEPALREEVERAFPGSTLLVDSDGRGRLEVMMESSSVFRPMRASELSDGTLHYLCLLAALLSPRPAALIVFNEPEAGLNPILFEPLAKLIRRASEKSQIILTTHSEVLAEAIENECGSPAVHLVKRDGITRVMGKEILEEETQDTEELEEPDH